MEFDEEKAIVFIKNALAKVGITAYGDDDILNIIDIIWEYYEESGLTDLNDLDSDMSEEEDILAVSAYVKKMLAKDNGNIVDLSDVDSIVKAEIEYEMSLV